MKEKRLSIDKIVKELDKKGVAVILPICKNCMIETECQLLGIYSTVIFKAEQVGDELYSLTIIL